MLRCPSCLSNSFESYTELSEHFIEKASSSDADHIMWLNRYAVKKKSEAAQLAGILEKFFRTGSVRSWIIEAARNRFFGESPNPYIQAMQHPTKWLLLGYAFEHHHFLKQWVRSCSLIVANTDREDVQNYELDNIVSEWHGSENVQSHHELLLKMAESYGATREEIYRTEPLAATVEGTRFWDSACRNFSFVEGMAAMHSMELIPSRKMKDYGSKITYFDPAILTDGSISAASVAFLKEGYEADAGHSESALELIERYSPGMGLVQPCQALALKSLDKFYDYLIARLQRGNMIENKQH